MHRWHHSHRNVGTYVLRWPCSLLKSSWKRRGKQPKAWPTTTGDEILDMGTPSSYGEGAGWAAVGYSEPELS
jgi:hypothetical protein